MIDIRVFSFLKNVFIFLIDRLYKEWVYMCGNGRSYSEEASERGDLYAKQLIENIIHDRARKHDPYMVDGISAISYGTASVLLGEARVTGLDTLHRANKCFLTDTGNRAFINGTFGAGPLTYQREIVFEFGDFKRKTSVLVSLMDIKVSVDFSIEKETGRNGFLQNFAVNKLNGFNLSINGLGYFDWAINLVLSFLTLVLGRIVRNLLENELEQYILHGLPKYQFPVEGASYKKRVKFNIPPEDVKKNEASLYETFCMIQNCVMPKWSRVSPIAEESVSDVGKGYNSIEYVAAKDFGSNLETTNTPSSLLQTNNQTTEVNSFCLPEQSLAVCSGSLRNNSCNEVTQDKSEDNCDRFSALSRETLNIFRSLNRIKEKLTSISHITNSSPQERTSKNRLEGDYPLFAWSIPEELNDISETESNSGESTASAILSPVKDFGLKSPQKVSFLVCERRENTEKESKMEDSSQMLRGSCRDLVEMASEDCSGNAGESEQLVDIFSEIRELSCRKNVDENALDAGIELSTSVAKNNSSPSTKTELSQIDDSALCSSILAFSAEGGTFLDPSPSHALKMFIEEISDERTEDLNNQHQSPEVDSSAPNFDLNLCKTVMFQNDFFDPCKDDGLAKDPKVFKVLAPENETQIEDSESIKSYYTEMLSRNQGVEMPETRCISNPDGRVNGETLLKFDIISDSMEPTMVQDENFDSEMETELISQSLQFSEKHDEEVNERIPCKYAECHTVDELNKDSLNKPDEVYTSDSPRNSEKLNTTNFQNEDAAHNNLLEKLACLLNESDTECTDCVVEFSCIAGSKFNADSHNCLAETPDIEAMSGLLQKEIIAKTLELKSGVVLESDSEDNEYTGSFTVSSYKDLEFETEGLRQKYSKRNDSEVSCLPKRDGLSLSSTGSSTESIEMTELASSERNVLKHEMVKFIKEFTDCFTSEIETNKINWKQVLERF